MIDQEQTTQTTEMQSSEVVTTEENPSSQTNTSTTVDLSQDDDAGDTTAETTETEDTRTDEEKASDAARAELFGAPAEDASYEIEGLPEGMAIDAAGLEAITPVARELGLSNKGLSKIAGVYAEKVLPEVQKQVVTNIEQDIIATRRDWENQSIEAVKSNGAELKNKAGEVLAFDGKDIETVRKTAARALDRIAPQGFREWLKETGLSVHPQMVAFTYQAGKLLAEETDIDKTDRGDRRPKSRVEKYYG
ncbi:MAG: hypothetical protein ACJ8FS_16290 [Sphingomicrobium sp.]